MVKSTILSYLKYIYKLEIITGLALIQKEVEADNLVIDNNTNQYVFKEYVGHNQYDTLGYYPIVNTIIASIEENPDYIHIIDREDYNNDDYGARDY